MFNHQCKTAAKGIYGQLSSNAKCEESRETTVLNVVKPRTCQRRMKLEIATKVPKKKRQHVATHETRQKREDKERGDYQRYFYMLGKHGIRRKQYKRHPRLHATDAERVSANRKRDKIGAAIERRK